MLLPPSEGSPATSSRTTAGSLTSAVGTSMHCGRPGKPNDRRTMPLPKAESRARASRKRAKSAQVLAILRA